MNWNEIAKEVIDLGTDKVKLYCRLDGFTETCALIEVAREEVRNAIDGQTTLALLRALDELDQRPKLKTLFITGSGEKAFISGGDLKDYTSRLDQVDKVREALGLMRQVLYRMYAGLRFTVAIINGPARGGGSEIAFSCHYRMMKKDANFGFVQATQGIPPGWGGGVLLARHMGESKARLALMSGSLFEADVALAMGYVDELYPSDESLIAKMRNLSGRFEHSTVSGAKAVHAQFSDDHEKILHQMERESESCADLWFKSEHMAILDRYS